VIGLNSRYAENPVVPFTVPVLMTSVSDGVLRASVFRSPPTAVVGRSVKYYMWKDGDRLDQLAAEKFADPRYWWKILDLNPEIPDPMLIEPGTIIRLPA
jgi:hypothetical protein